MRHPAGSGGTTHPLLLHARSVIELHFEGRNWRERWSGEPSTPSRGCFISLKIGDRLRGCIGTILPARGTLEEEVAENALAAATRDPRFAPLRREELPATRFSIDLLTPPEPVMSDEELEPARYGVLIRAGGRCGVLLPDLPGVDSVQRQIEICRKKAGISADAPVEMSRFEVERFQE